MNSKIREGDLFRILIVDGESFEIRYGYYEERERSSKYNDPIPIYPNFLEAPKYNREGYPFVTEMQDTCEYFKGRMLVDICCGCAHFKKGDDLVGICTCEKKRKNNCRKGEGL